MIQGVGIDLLAVARMRRALAGPRFPTRVFTDAERERVYAAVSSAQTAAGIFCAKEAFAKATGGGLFSFAFHEVEVCKAAGGQPYLKLSDRMKALYPGIFHLSITHTKETAAAVVVYEGAGESDSGRHGVTRVGKE